MPNNEQNQKTMSSKYFIDSSSSDYLYRSIAPELKTISVTGGRASVRVYKTPKKVIIKVTASDITSCRAATNSWLRLALIATEVDKLVSDSLEQHPSHPSSCINNS